LALAAVTFFQACDKQDELSTSPSLHSPVRPQARIVSTTVTALPLGGRAINDAGQVVGDGPGGRAILWSASEGAVDLGTLGGSIASARGINDGGQVVGWSQVEGSLSTHAFLWKAGQGMQDLFVIAGMTAANDINNRGQVVGSGPGPDGKMHALLWTPGQGTQDLGTLGGLFTASIAYAINEAGEVVGESFMPNDPSGLHRAVLWRPGQRIRDLGTLGGQFAIARDINESGQVVGEALTQFGPHRAFLWTEAHGMQDLGSVGNFNSSAFAINDAGVVVGETDSEFGPSHAGLWTAADGMEDLGVIGMSVAFDINNHLQVVGPLRLVQVELGPSNRAPVASAGGPYTGSEGSAVTFAFSATDADGDALTYTWDLGDGTTGSGPAPPASHIYADDGIYSVSLSVSDTKGATDMKTTTATIANVAPTIVTGSLTGPANPIALVSGTASASISLAFTDPAGASDVYTARIDCGNGTTRSTTGVASPFSDACLYTSAGIFTVSATVADEDGGTSQAALYRYVIVYDPAGPSTSGSGFISVAGGPKGKAHFTFGASFPGSSLVPDGKAKFWIPGGSLDFESSVVQMLVVSGNRVQFWGTGTLDGGPASFRITAVDGGRAGREGSGDAFRIELWQRGILVFDTQPGAAQDAPVTTPLGGGNIQIHP
jgi:probable HAF family extracellular repeat protein